jgi:preprotein translocase subunit SecE
MRIPIADSLFPIPEKTYAPRQNHFGLQRLQKPELLHHEEQAPPPGARRVEEVLPALQQARRPQGNEVTVATAQVPKENVFARLVKLYNEVVAEMKKVTWPDVGQVRQLSIGVIVLSLFIGIIIWLMDLILQQVLVRWIPSLFGG